MGFAQHEAYQAASDLSSTAQNKFETLASNALTAVDRSNYRANALAAARDVELLDNQYRAFLNGEADINPPDDATVALIQATTAELAATVASDDKAAAILDLLNQGMNTFADLHVPS